ncbi:MAG TPA: ATP-grasp domain-containing protein [Thermoleophilaceae bacterium]|nr:ATP-grasp domain-containing protein [Thermoleophilaceae bacterium]
MTATRVKSAAGARTTPASRPGAVVLGGDYVGLGMVRSLGPQGVPLCVVDDEPSISRFSKYVQKAIRIPSIGDLDRTADDLLRVGREQGLEGWVLFPTRDEAVAALARHHEELSRFFRVSSPTWDRFEWAWDKRKTYELASRLGIPSPRTWYPDTVEEVADVDCEPPFVVKPAIKPRFLAATKRKAWRADSRPELERLFAEARSVAEGDPIMVQEFLPGYGERQFAYCALFKSGSALGSMVARRVRQHPMDFGRASTYVETVESPEMEDLARRFLAEIDFYGLVEVEFKEDATTGNYNLLDVNARCWGYHSLGPAAGVDFPYLCYADMLGAEPYPERRARPGVTWMRLLTDAPTAALEIRARRLRLRSYLAELRGRPAEAVISMSDPKPALAELALIPHLAKNRAF